MTTKKIADVIERGYKVVITHGNGPQVGATLLRHDAGMKVYKEAMHYFKRGRREALKINMKIQK
jgi:carbamate kinase